MTKTLLYDEKKIAKSIYENGFTDGIYNRREGFLIAKYIRHLEKCGDKKLKTLLIEFCSGGEGFSEIAESNYIKKMVRNSKHEFIQRIRISITQKEIDAAQTIKNFQSQKIYLSMLKFN